MSRAQDDDRLHALDVLRGLALFAMILVHFHQKMRIEMPSSIRSPRAYTSGTCLGELP